MLYYQRDIRDLGNAHDEIPKLKISTYGAVVRTQRGYVYLIFNQYTHHGQGKSIHSSCLQLKDNSVQVDNHPSALGGTQSLVTVEGYVVPFDVVKASYTSTTVPSLTKNGTPSLMSS